jgi:hypothetical protein
MALEEATASRQPRLPQLQSGPVPEYKPDACPQTMEWLGRSVHMEIPPQLTEKDCGQITEGIRKVATVLL